MAVTHKKLFHLLIDKGMTNAELVEKSGLSLLKSSVTIIFISIPLRRFAKLSIVESMIFWSLHQIKENRTAMIYGGEYCGF